MKLQSALPGGASVRNQGKPQEWAVCSEGAMCRLGGSSSHVPRAFGRGQVGKSASGPQRAAAFTDGRTDMVQGAAKSGTTYVLWFTINFKALLLHSCTNVSRDESVPGHC